MLNERTEGRALSVDRLSSERERTAARIYNNILDAADVDNPNRAIYLLHYNGARKDCIARVEYKGMNGRHVVVRSPRKLHHNDRIKMEGYFEAEELSEKMLDVRDIRPGIGQVNWFLRQDNNGGYEGVRESSTVLGEREDELRRQRLTDPDILDILDRTSRLAQAPQEIADNFITYDAFISALRNATDDLMPGVVTYAERPQGVDDYEDGEIRVLVFGDDFGGRNLLPEFVQTLTLVEEERSRVVSTYELAREQEAISRRERQKSNTLRQIQESRYLHQEELFAFLVDAFNDTREMELSQRVIKGQYHKDFDDIFADAVTKFTSNFPTLPQELLFSLPYIQRFLGKEGKRIINQFHGLSFMEQVTLSKLRKSKDDALMNLVDEKVVPEIADQVLEPGLLDEPPYEQQSGARLKVCTVASIRMLFGGITGERISESAFVNARSHYLYKSEVEDVIADGNLHDEEYLALFQTPSFKKRYGKDVRTIALSGVSLDDISRVVKKLKAKDEELKVYAMISLVTDHPLTKGDGVWHSGILLSADAENVVIHDPSIATGQPNRVIPKGEFVKRWGEAFLRGHLVVTK